MNTSLPTTKPPAEVHPMQALLDQADTTCPRVETSARYGPSPSTHRR